jgi:hypothetical protein
MADLEAIADEKRLSEIAREFGEPTRLKDLRGILAEVRMNRAKRSEYFGKSYRKEDERPSMPVSNAKYLDQITDGDVLTYYNSWKEFIGLVERFGPRGPYKRGSPDVPMQKDEKKRWSALWGTLRPYINRTRSFGLIQAVHQYLHEKGLVEEAQPGINPDSWRLLMRDVQANISRARYNAGRITRNPPRDARGVFPATGWHRFGNGFVYGNPDHMG